MIVAKTVTPTGTHFRRISSEHIYLEETVIDGKTYYMPIQSPDSKAICDTDIFENPKLHKEIVNYSYTVQYKVREFKGKLYMIKMVNKFPISIMLLTDRSKNFTSKYYGDWELFGYLDHFLGYLEFCDRYAKDVDYKGIVRRLYDFETDQEVFPRMSIVRGERVHFNTGWIEFCSKDGHDYAMYFGSNLKAVYDFERKELRERDSLGKVTMYHTTFFDNSPY